MRTIDHHFQTVEADIWPNRLFDRVDVAARRVINPARPPDVGGSNKFGLCLDQGLNCRFIVV